MPEGFQAAPNSELSEEGLPLRIVCDADGSEMVLVPAGAFPRGTNSGPSNAAPEHTVYLDAYYISKHEVTLEQFAKFREAHDKLGRRRLATPSNEAAHVRMPVLGLPHRDATAFAEWAKCALPTEAQWEKAARGINGYPYPWGYERPVWPAARPLDDVAQVMTYRTDVSPYGVFDLAGNAREWVADVYAEGYPEAGPNGEKLLRNPTGPRRTSSSPGVIRGNGPDWKVWHRVSNLFGQPPADVGFRCVLNLPAPGAEPAADENSRQPAPGRGF